MRARVWVVSAAVVMVGLGTSASGATVTGTALEETGGELGISSATPGTGHWIACTGLRNISSEPIDLIGAEVVGAPAHWRTGPVRAVDTRKAGAVAPGARDETFAEEPGMAEDLSGQPLRVEPGEFSRFTYYLRVEAVSAPVAGRAEGCRVTYRQAHRVYVQDMALGFVLHSGVAD
ncbi:hypothetical protein ACFWOY_31640 [Streptomyces sp. NPDC058423]|uniref:hypothetical protein n=1 Tax=unclassified Streptomyces TaxID=2593676 RepID=UPI003661A929